MDRDVDVMESESGRPPADDAEASIVAGHLAARRVERRVIAICAVLAVVGLVMLVGALISGETAARLPMLRAVSGAQ